MSWSAHHPLRIGCGYTCGLGVTVEKVSIRFALSTRRFTVACAAGILGGKSNRAARARLKFSSLELGLPKLSSSTNVLRKPGPEVSLGRTNFYIHGDHMFL